MPRRTAGRSLAYERNLSAQVRRLRADRSWSLEQLAKVMSAGGCPIAPSSIYKIETSDPPRTVGVNELYAFAAAFGVEPEALVAPPPAGDDEELEKALMAISSARARLEANLAEFLDLIAQVLTEVPAAANHWSQTTSNSYLDMLLLAYAASQRDASATGLGIKPNSQHAGPSWLAYFDTASNAAKLPKDVRHC